MAVTLKFPPEPLTLNAQHRPGQQMFTESKQSESLLNILRQYWRLETKGHTILVAGHRGAGKTTMVHSTLDRARNRAGRWLEEQRDENQSGGYAELNHYREFLPVLIDAPTLFQPSTAKDQDPQQDDQAQNGDDAAASASTESKKEQDVPPPAFFLQNLMTALYRSLCGHLVRKAAQTTGCPDPELIYHLANELDMAPEAGVIRDYWRRMGVVDSGLLFKKDRRPTDQGARELNAVTTAAKAYQKIIATVTQESTDKKNDKAVRQRAEDSAFPKIDLTVEKSASTGPQPNGKLIFALLAAILSGGASVAEFGANSAVDVATTAGIAAVAGLTVHAFGSAFFSSKLERNFEGSKQVSHKTDLASLSRDLPVLLGRLRDAGILPVFIIDELDKLDNTKDAVSQVVRHIKRLLSENGMYIFLCDRDYYEHLTVADAEGKRHRESTYFQQWHFVTFLPEQTFSYLRKVVTVPEDRSADAPQDLRSIQVAYILVAMRRGHMHQIGIKRALYELASEDGRIWPPVRQGRRNEEPPNVWNIYRRDLLMQLAVLVAINNDGSLKRRMENSPHFTQQAYDALYYPVRSWEKKESTLDTSREAFYTYMLDRDGIDKESRETAILYGPNFLEMSQDLKWLHRKMELVAEYIAAPSKILTILEAGKEERGDADSMSSEGSFAIDCLRALTNDLGVAKDVVQKLWDRLNDQDREALLRWKSDGEYEWIYSGTDWEEGADAGGEEPQPSPEGVVEISAPIEADGPAPKLPHDPRKLLEELDGYIAVARSLTANRS